MNEEKIAQLERKCADLEKELQDQRKILLDYINSEQKSNDELRKEIKHYMLMIGEIKELLNNIINAYRNE